MGGEGGMGWAWTGARKTLLFMAGAKEGPSARAAGVGHGLDQSMPKLRRPHPHRSHLPPPPLQRPCHEKQCFTGSSPCPTPAALIFMVGALGGASASGGGGEGGVGSVGAPAMKSTGSQPRPPPPTPPSAPLP